MSSSLRARRIARNHKRMFQQPRLNLVALMDIFTILVLFLMVNSGDVEVLQSDRSVTLPESVSEQRPELALTIRITGEEIVVQERTIESIDAALEQTEAVLPNLVRELRDQASLEPTLSKMQQELGRAVIIMGDRDTPYKLLKRIMTTCAEAGYRDISLAVNSRPPGPVAETTVTVGGI